MASQTIVFDRTGTPLCFLRASVHRWWSLNEYGGAEFELPLTDPKVTRRNLAFGNLVLVRRAGLPDWGGVIDTPREWDTSRKTVTVTAYGAEYLLTFRLPGKVGKTLYGSAGANFREIVAMANLRESLNIRLGAVDDQGAGREDKVLVSAENGLYDTVCEIARDSGHDWAVLPKLDAAGRLAWEARWWKKRGRETGFTLREGRHLAGGAMLSEQGKIVNWLLVLGDASSGSTIPRYLEPTDWDSAGAYGLREGSEKTDLTGDAALAENAHTRIAYLRNPRLTVSLTVIDAGGAFSALDVGNTVGVDLANSGFAAAASRFGWSGKIRITGMDYSDDENTTELIAEEVIS